MSENLEELAILENEEMQEKQDIKEKVNVPLQKVKVKVSSQPDLKKERTPQQIETTKKMIETRNLNIKIKKEQQEQEALIKKKELEDKIISKAISIKKKEIKRKAILEEISDDETSVETIKKIVKNTAQKEPEKKSIFEKYKFV